MNTLGWEHPRVEYPRMEYPRMEYPRVEQPRVGQLGVQGGASPTTHTAVQSRATAGNPGLCMCCFPAVIFMMYCNPCCDSTAASTAATEPSLRFSPVHFQPQQTTHREQLASGQLLGSPPQEGLHCCSVVGLLHGAFALSQSLH